MHGCAFTCRTKTGLLAAILCVVLFYFGNYKKKALLEQNYFFFDLTGRFFAGGGAYMKLRLAETVKRLNIERPTSNVEY